MTDGVKNAWAIVDCLQVAEQWATAAGDVEMERAIFELRTIAQVRASGKERNALYA